MDRAGPQLRAGGDARAAANVVTANKQLLSQYGDELFAVAGEFGVQLRFEGAVAGVVPVIRVLQESLAGARIDRVHGIVNGTTNFILSEMARLRITFEQALGEGPASLLVRSPDPTTMSTDATPPRRWRSWHGWRSARRCIWTRSVTTASDRSPPTTWNTRASWDSALADRHRRAHRRGTFGARAPWPSRIPAIRSPVNGPFNAVTVESNEITEITMSGPGAGGPQTATAVLGDVVSAMIPPASAPEEKVPLLPIVADIVSAFYLHSGGR